MADGSDMAQGVTIIREDCEAFWQVTAWPDTLGAVASRLGEITGVAAPGPGGLVAADTGQIARIGPLVWWIIGANAEAVRALADIGAQEGSALDMTDNRVRFVISGPRARDMMMRLAPLDFRDRSFAVGTIAATAAHHMSVQIARREEAWDVYVTATFADAFAEVLAETAAQWG